ncbi:MAG: hypothetical protein AVDCRST_MAG18-4189, partial [uncultured Thermomicrobiales bacterium]
GVPPRNPRRAQELAVRCARAPAAVRQGRAPAEPDREAQAGRAALRRR